MDLGNLRIRYAILAIIPLVMLFGWFLVKPYVAQTNISTITSPAGLSNVTVPQGFQVNVFAAGLEGPRFILVEGISIRHLSVFSIINMYAKSRFWFLWVCRYRFLSTKRWKGHNSSMSALK